MEIHDASTCTVGYGWGLDYWWGEFIVLSWRYYESICDPENADRSFMIAIFYYSSPLPLKHKISHVCFDAILLFVFEFHVGETWRKEIIICMDNIQIVAF